MNYATSIIAATLALILPLAAGKKPNVILIMTDGATPQS